MRLTGQCRAGLLSAILGVSLASGQTPSRHYAVVVGIDSYSSSHWRHLSYAEADASAIGSILKSQGYEVTELRPPHASRQEILEALYSVAAKLKPTDSFLFFFAGHGASEHIGSENWGYIVPSDGTDATSYISGDDLQSVSRRLKTARHQIFIIDACYSGLMLTRSGGVDPNTPNYISEVEARISREALSAGGADQEVLDVGGDGHSVFTRALMDGLAGAADLNGDGFITYPELQAYITPRASNAFQTPAGGVFPGHAGGEFVFTSPKGKTLAASNPRTLPSNAIKRGEDTDGAPVVSPLLVTIVPSASGGPDPLEGPKKLLLAGRFAEATAALRVAADSGDTDAMFYLGLTAGKGWGMPKDYAEARKWYGKAADAGDGRAMADLGILYESNDGGPQDYTLARRWLEAGAKAGNAQAINSLGLLYAQGLGVPVDYAKAKKQFELAVAASYPNGFTNMGMLYSHGYGVTRNSMEARQWYIKAAAAGSSEGMYKVGASYDQTHDYRQAREWYDKAAAAGSGLAMAQIGYLYAIGKGVGQNYDKAREWFQKGAALGDPEAISYLARLDGEGFGLNQSAEAQWERVRKDADDGNVEAMIDLAEHEDRTGPSNNTLEIRRLLTKAAAAGSFVAMDELGNTYTGGYGRPEDYTLARQWFEKAAAGGDADAMLQLGDIYAGGKAVTIDYLQARHWYEKGAGAGSRDCMRRLAGFYREGHGVTRNPSRAQELEDQAKTLEAKQ